MSTAQFTPECEQAAMKLFRDCITRIPEEEWGNIVQTTIELQPTTGHRLASMLQFQAQNSSWLKGTALSPSSDTSSHLAVPEPGDVLGQYRVIQVLGHGTASVLIKASGPRWPVVLKLPVTRLAVAPCLQKFYNECNIHTDLSHRNITRAVRVDLVERGIPMLVTEFIDGMNIQQTCIRRNLSTTDKMDLLLQVTSGVRYLHNSGYTHGDIKCENIMIETRESQLVAKLIDFGKAQDFLVGNDSKLGRLQPELKKTHGLKENSIDQADRIIARRRRRKSNPQTDFENGRAKDLKDLAWLRNCVLTL